MFTHVRVFLLLLLNMPAGVYELKIMCRKFYCFKAKFLEKPTIIIITGTVKKNLSFCGMSIWLAQVHADSNQHLLKKKIIKCSYLKSSCQ